METEAESPEQIPDRSDVTGRTHSGPDWLLTTLVSLVELGDGGITIGITLNVGGFLVSGQLASGKSYLKQFADNIANGFKQTSLKETALPEQMRTMFEGMGARIYGHSESDGDGPNSAHEHETATFIHVRDVKFYNTGGRPIPESSEGIWWRGRLSEVAGWCLGSLSEGSADG